jgi:hypothetical protein
MSLVLLSVKPRIDKTSLKSITIKQGQTVTIDAPYVAEPYPTMTWRKATTVHRCSIESNEISC